MLTRGCLVLFGVLSIALGWQGMQALEAAYGAASQGVNYYSGMLFIGAGLLALAVWEWAK